MSESKHDGRVTGPSQSRTKQIIVDWLKCSW